MSPPDAGCRARVYIPAPTCCSLLDASLFPPSTHPTGNSQFHSLKRTINYRQRRQQKNCAEETSAMCHMCHLRSLLYPPPLAAGCGLAWARGELLRVTPSTSMPQLPAVFIGI